MVVLSSNYYLIHLFLSPLVVTSISIIQKYADNFSLTLTEVSLLDLI